MYWIYLAVFILMVLTPGIVKCPVFSLNEENTEEIVIFLLGIIGFLIFNYKENQLSFNLKEKQKVQKEATETSKDLAHSYSYIGEINRKLEILNNISLKLAEAPNMNSAEREYIYKLILDAIKTLAKTDRFTIIFANLSSRVIVKEVGKSNKKLSPKVKNLILNFGKRKKIINADDHTIIQSSKNIDGISAFISIRIKNKQALKDLELLKTLATQALLLRLLTKERD